METNNKQTEIKMNKKYIKINNQDKKKIKQKDRYSLKQDREETNTHDTKEIKERYRQRKTKIREETNELNLTQITKTDQKRTKKNKQIENIDQTIEKRKN